LDRNRERDIDAEDEEELYERRKLERRLREKEAAYQEVLKLPHYLNIGKFYPANMLCNKNKWYSMVKINV